MTPGGQQELFGNEPTSRCAKQWSEELSQQLARPVQLSYGRARRNVIVAKSEGQALRVRLNEHFKDAPPEVSEALGAWLKNGKRARRACRVLDNWIDELSQRLGAAPRRQARIRQAGAHVQLKPLAGEVIEAHFGAGLPSLPSELGDWPSRVTWGRRGSRRARRSIQLGSYCPEQRLIRVHPVLDQTFVPRFFVRYVLFHELLHAALDRHPRPEHAARERPHPPEFREREQAYPEYQRALDWQRENLRLLLSSARSLGRG